MKPSNVLSNSQRKIQHTIIPKKTTGGKNITVFAARFVKYLLLAIAITIRDDSMFLNIISSQRKAITAWWQSAPTVVAPAWKAQ